MGSELKISVYPVPTSMHNMHVRVLTPEISEIRIQVLDIMGRVLFSETFSVAELSEGVLLKPGAPVYDGIYFITAMQKGIKVRKKILIQN